MPHDHSETREGGYPCLVQCLLCLEAPTFVTLDQLAEHYIRTHPISVVVPPRSLRVVAR
jgi:hypothetical protein